ncbi:MAG: ATP-binding protein [Legionellales bacterium]|nr:ATP-binding protein [Legionellales bacterium]
MKIAKDELIKVLSQFNPWWRGESIADLPLWYRASFQELFAWVTDPPAPRAVLLSGARQVGKTTLLSQVIDGLLNKQGVPAANILYATFDHPLIKIAGIDAVLEAWREREPKTDGPEYLFLDEAQFIREWGTWIKHQVDFEKNRRIIFTGSAMPLIYKHQESGVGRWHTIKLSTLSFYEYLQLKDSQKSKNPSQKWVEPEKLQKELREKIQDFSLQLQKQINLLDPLEMNLDLSHINFSKSPFPKLPELKRLKDLFLWSKHEFQRTAELITPLVGHFHEYLVRGGFPQLVQVDSINQSQKLLREDIIDKVLKRDMTALFGVRRVLDLEQTFLYLCMHDGGLLDMVELCENLEVKRPTAQHYIELLEATHLIYRLQPFGYGKDILRGKYKIYLADAAIASAVLLKGKNILENTSALGVATETAVFKHLFAHYYPQDVRFSHWRGHKDHEVELVAEIGEQIIPFEVKYREKKTGERELKGLIELCQKKSIEHAYVITKSLNDFGPLESKFVDNTKIMRIPAALLCYWMGASELSQTNLLI